MDSLGRGALTIAIDTENLEMVELLVIMSVETRDALLQAINAEFVEAVELLLEVIFISDFPPPTPAIRQKLILSWKIYFF